MIYRFGIEPNGPAIIISDVVLEKMFRYQQLRDSDLEAGGQLFARFEGQDTYILDATPPKPTDKRGRHSFRPNKWLQKLEIRAKRLCAQHFVGDWHTHPELIPSKSPIDRESIHACFRESRHQLKAFLMVIVGTEAFPNGIAVYLADNDNIKLLKQW